MVHVSNCIYSGLRATGMPNLTPAHPEINLMIVIWLDKHYITLGTHNITHVTVGIDRLTF